MLRKRGDENQNITTILKEFTLIRTSIICDFKIENLKFYSTF